MEDPYMNILHRRTLGYLLDACNIITCKTARRDTWIDLFIKAGNEEKDLIEIDTLLDRFKNINPKLLLLGYRDRKLGSLIGNIFYNYADEYIGKWDNDSFIKYLCNIDNLKNSISQYYFHQDYSDDIFESISASEDIRPELKSLLFDFYLFPKQYVEMMQYELQHIFQSLDMCYQEKLPLIVSCQEAFNYEVLLSHENSPFAKQNKWDKQIKRCYASFALVSKYALARGKKDDLGWIMLGYDYSRTFEEMYTKPLDIAGFGNALGDKLRVKIVELLIKNGEMTLADLSRELDVVNTIAIYHMDVLKKENLLLYRHSGRKVFYCMNLAQIKLGLEAINKICGGEL